MQKSIKVYYYYSYSFADAITPLLINRIIDRRRISRKPIPAINGNLENKVGGPFFLSLGSIFHHANDGDVIWGSGINPVWQKKIKDGIKLDIRAVRGPLTQYYAEKELGIECPKIYGDPILLFPNFFPEFKVHTKRDYIVILQHNDEEFVLKNKDFFKNANILICQRYNRLPWFEVVREILSSSFVISSSLHGLIFAEIYGIPARWLYNERFPSSRTETRFKYNDYYTCTGRSMNDFASSIDEALEMGGKEPIASYDPGPFIKSFPYDCFRNKYENIFWSLFGKLCLN
jgi:pyruvyltransferase